MGGKLSLNEVIKQVDIEEIIQEYEKEELIRLKRENTRFKKIRRYVAGASIGVLLLGGAYLAWRNYNPSQGEADRTEYVKGIQQEQGETTHTIETAVEKKPQESAAVSPYFGNTVHVEPETSPAKSDKPQTHEQRNQPAEEPKEIGSIVKRESTKTPQTNAPLTNTGQEALEGQGVKVIYFFKDIHTGKPLMNVEVLAYPCLDKGCNTLDLSHPLPGTGNSGSSSHKTITYPTDLATQYGYAAYYFAHGYVSMESNPTWHGTGSTSWDINFVKVQNCKSDINSMTVSVNPTNQYPASATVNMQATVKSAFTNPNNNVGYVLPQYADEFYSSMVEVKFSVYNSSNELVHSEKKAVNIINIKMDSKEIVYHSLMPFGKGDYNAEVETTVTDSKCINTMPQIKKIKFYVK